MTPGERRVIVLLAKELEDYDSTRGGFAPAPEEWRLIEAARKVVQLLVTP